MPKQDYEKAVSVIGDIMKNEDTKCRILGINMEGPFLGADKKGAHDENCLMAPNNEWFNKLDSLCDNNIKLVDLDPKLPHSLEFIKNHSKTKTISIAHTSCDFALANECFAAGANHITHLFNAMDGLHHRKPGILGALFENDFQAEIICDGIHIHPTVVKMMFTLFPKKLILISDSMRAAGLSDGKYTLGGLDVFVNDGKATSADGTIAGSTITIYDALRNVVEFGVPLETAIESATIRPAESIGMDSEIGSIAVGKRADFVVLDKNLNIKEVISKGLII